MHFSYFLLIQLCLIVHKGINHGFQSALLHLLRHIISVVAMRVGLFPHGVCEEKSHVKLYRSQQL